ncbi:MAG: hypothetical protein WDA16_00240 [Candidatus Thermoplasmatota archaeon]
MKVALDSITPSLDTYFGWPQCPVDATVKTRLAMINAISMMKEAFCETGFKVDEPSQNLVVEPERRHHQ